MTVKLTAKVVAVTIGLLFYINCTHNLYVLFFSENQPPEWVVNSLPASPAVFILGTTLLFRYARKRFIGRKSRPNKPD